ncbi:hypothetical protein [Bacillus suaedaesalsae]|uniref:DUF4286 family protein n=1 Tax=Bacillus suaedaesalsae TaxID=2810349 RepID=A0ABS2DDC4_9BACI|nr:hypothetical protein [Bacillus suaedaesalsae]MBM6616461.1 hypothetical protein [Bacillus suaedaesalsae]
MSIKIFIEYKVKESFIQQYEEQMEKVLDSLPSFGARQIEWFQNGKQHYIETFSLPTISHFVAFRKMRGEKLNQIYGCLDQFMEGGIDNIQMHAVKVK